jgi:hypothetical protein
MNSHHIFQTLTSSLLLLAGSQLLGCGAAVATEELEAYDSAPIEDDELASTAQPLNNIDPCGEAEAPIYDRLFPRPALVTNAAYEDLDEDCPGATFLRVTNYRMDTKRQNIVSWGSPVPTSRAACENAQIKVYVFHIPEDGDPDYIENFATARGTWFKDTQQCSKPTVNVETQWNLRRGDTYQFAVAATNEGTQPPTYKKISWYSS